MKKIVLIIVMLSIPTLVCAGSLFDSDLGGSSSGSRPYEDAWGNNYKKKENLYKDTDHDGVINKYDYNDRNRNIQTPDQQDYSNPYGSSGTHHKKNRLGW